MKKNILPLRMTGTNLSKLIRKPLRKEVRDMQQLSTVYDEEERFDIVLESPGEIRNVNEECNRDDEDERKEDDEMVSAKQIPLLNKQS